jgi:catechol 2,3-dioxygenase-like lactoylglutathione lyase family enzyme
MKVDALDHLVLTVKDIDASIEFYSKVLGMGVVTFNGNRKALSFGKQKINLHQSGNQKRTSQLRVLLIFAFSPLFHYPKLRLI